MRWKLPPRLCPAAVWHGTPMSVQEVWKTNSTGKEHSFFSSLIQKDQDGLNCFPTVPWRGRKLIDVAMQCWSSGLYSVSTTIVLWLKTVRFSLIYFLCLKSSLGRPVKQNTCDFSAPCYIWVSTGDSLDFSKGFFFTLRWERDRLVAISFSACQLSIQPYQTGNLAFKAKHQTQPWWVPEPGLGKAWRRKVVQVCTVWKVREARHRERMALSGVMDKALPFTNVSFFDNL